MAGRVLKDGRSIITGVAIEAMVRVAFGAIHLSGNLSRGTAGERNSESVAGSSSY